ncbi:MAG: choice-of-anchor L domain-containing protein, partial [Bacteroidales bacterium]
MKRFTKILIVLLLAFISREATGQSALVVENTLTPQQLVQQILIGSGVTVSNITFEGSLDNAIGDFSNGDATNLGLDEGVVMSSGKVLEIPNDVSFFASNSNNTPGDPDLTALAGVPTNDAAVLEFDFVPQSDTLTFNYVFGSEEYKEYVCSNYNDVFGFFIWGDNPATGENYDGVNIALIPESDSIPVSINTVNHGGVTNPPPGCLMEYSEYYVDNELEGGIHIAYDGFTTVFTATVIVEPCETYHIKLAIADGMDYSYDSGVFLEANSFSARGLNTSTNFSQSSDDFGATVEGCNDATIVFELYEPLPYDYVIQFNVQGTATPDVDYPALPDSLVIPSGSISDSVTIQPFQDDIQEPTENVVLIYDYESVCNDESDTLVIEIMDNSLKITGLDSLYCEDDPPDTLAGYPPGGYFTGNGMVDSIFDPSLAGPGTDTIHYEYFFLDSIGNTVDTICANSVMQEVTISPVPEADAGIDDSICENLPYDFSTAPVVPSASDYDSINWSGGAGSFSDPGYLTPVYYPAPGEIGDVVLTLIAYGQTPCGDDTSSMTLTILENPTGDFTISPNDTSCVGELVSFDATGSGDVTTWDWSFGDGATATGQNVTHTYSSPGTYSVMLVVGNDNGCL